MSVIGKRWTGNGLAEGTTLTSANVNTTGNGDTVSGSFTTGTAVMVTEGDGFRIQTDVTSAARRIDATVSGTAVRVQYKLTPKTLPGSTNAHTMVVRDSTTNMAIVYLTQGGAFGLIVNGGVFPSGAQTPAISANDSVLIDLVVTQSASPTTSNGRVFYRVKNLTNPTWNTTGEFFYDSGYTINVGTNAFVAIRFGKLVSETLPGNGMLFELPGWEVITVNPSDTSVAQAKTYFADAPVTSTPLANPTITVTGYTDPTTIGGSDGTITISWTAVAGAHHYEAAIVAGNVTSGFTASDTAAVSPKTFTGISAGPYTVAVRAKAS